jgi:uncharacterized protein YecE (DUF72 family)
MIRIGTCSWKYDSWRGLIYPDSSKINYLKEYSKSYNTVEIDQWFWSLFEKSKVVLPRKNIAEAYKNSVPKDFLFTIKVPNSITLTHYYKKTKEDELKPNPFFLSPDLFNQFLDRINPLMNNIGCLIFQFEYLNKQKMKSLKEFQNKFYEFHKSLNKNTPQIGLEIRNPNYLNTSFFQFLNELNIAPVFLEGYYMPPVLDIYNKNKSEIKNLAVMRLHGPDRKGIEKIANENWNKIYVKRDREIQQIVRMIEELEKNEVDLFVNVNNHFEGSAPLTIQKIRDQL